MTYVSKTLYAFKQWLLICILLVCMCIVGSCSREHIAIKYTFRMPDGMVFTVLAYIPYREWNNDGLVWVIPGEFNPKTSEMSKVSHIRIKYRGCTRNPILPIEDWSSPYSMESDIDDIALLGLYYTLNEQSEDYDFLKNKLIVAPNGLYRIYNKLKYDSTAIQIVNVPGSKWEILEYSRSYERYIMLQSADTIGRSDSYSEPYLFSNKPNISYVRLLIQDGLGQAYYHIGYPLVIKNDE